MDVDFASDFYRGFIPQDSDPDASELARRDATLDEALACTFPASDPIALNFDFFPLSRPDREQPDVKLRHVRQTFAGRT